MTEVPASVLADHDWVREDVRRAASMYGPATERVLGSIRWYSASSMLVAPPLEALVHTGKPADPALEAVLLDIHGDGRIRDSRSLRFLDGGVPRLAEEFARAIGPAVATIADVSGASQRSLWAIAADSIGNRLLWAASALGRAGAADEAIQVAGELGDGIAAAGAPMPRPLFTDVGGKPVVRRTSCCLIYDRPGGEKCTSCPKQPPEERLRRLRALLG
ncbi:Fe-S oxidoreductase [Saccharomonospora sp. CUA-673]|uniref:(2Fe-2S)-binding protein n=1 Tax=Saccharomonospora sp. CUA-673 TaxID=1904969 RepID=UPI00095FC919|nr:(2Fe-2S)-binding protein [Saccharomonospora sp. CUA-673]OLT47826.1 Fe-S oxidoreductase [Saccharomonospora sp. CUA-673]